MNTYREIVFIVQDILKNLSDDKHFNENHLVFLANKHRSLQLYRYYKNAKVLPESIMQTVCIDLEKSINCDSSNYTVKSVQTIPEIMDVGEGVTSAYLPDNPYNFRLVYVNNERFPFVHSNGFLRNIIYMTKGRDGKLELSSNNSVDASYLKKVQLKAVFENPAEANKISCNPDEVSCDELDGKFYVDDKLIVPILHSLLNDIAPGLYRPIDISNNAKDDLSNSSIDAFLRSIRNQKPYNTSAE